MATEFRQIVRVVNTDLDGNKPIYHALRKIKGINFSMSNAVCRQLKIDSNKKAGDLSDDEIKKIENLIKEPKELPPWLLNRRKDFDTGEDIHLVVSDLKFRKEFDIKRLQKIKSYRGIRLALGLPVRGQRTKAHFRKGSAVGVRKKGIKMQKKPTEVKGKEPKGSSKGGK